MIWTHLGCAPTGLCMVKTCVFTSTDGSNKMSRSQSKSWNWLFEVNLNQENSTFIWPYVTDVMSWKFNSSHHNTLFVSGLNPNVMSDEFFLKNFLRWWQQTATLQQPYPFYNVRWHILYCKSIPFTLRKATFCVLICYLSCCKKASFVLLYAVWWIAKILFLW